MYNCKCGEELDRDDLLFLATNPTEGLCPYCDRVVVRTKRRDVSLVRQDDEQEPDFESMTGMQIGHW